MSALAPLAPAEYQLLVADEFQSKPVLVPDPPSVESLTADAVRQLRAGLEASIAARLTSGSELIRSLERRRRDESLPTALAPLDALLGGGLARGKVTGIAGRGLRFSLVMTALAAATSIGEAATLIDVGDHFDPQIGEASGIDLRRLLWVRPKTMKQAAAAAEMLAATGFQLVVLDAGLPPLRGRIPDAGWVRLARTAEAHGTAMLISAPYTLTGTTSEAMLAMGRPRSRWIGTGREPRLLAGFDVTVRLEKHRHKRPGETASLSFRMVEAVPETNGASSSALSTQHSGPGTRFSALGTQDSRHAAPHASLLMPHAGSALGTQHSRLPATHAPLLMPHADSTLGTQHSRHAATHASLLVPHAGSALGTQHSALASEEAVA